MVKVRNTSQRRVEVTVAGVERTVKATKLDANEQKETGRVYPQGVTPDDDGKIVETYTHRIEVRPGQVVEVPDEVWEAFDRNGGAATHGLVAEG